MNKNLTNYFKITLHIGTDFVAPIFFGILLGRLIDFYWKTAPWGLVIFVLFGIMVGIRMVYQSAKKIMLTKRPPSSYEN